jgi:glycosyltransferase involved in cell wall biosynthesis
VSSLSIVIPTKNRPLLLRRALRSFAGVASSLEVIVVDDGSTPENADLNHLVCQDLPGCRYERLPGSRGAAAARNQGFRLSHGNYIWFMDDDDYATDRTVSDALSAAANGLGAEILLMPRNVILDGVALDRCVPADEPDKFERYRKVGIEVTSSCALIPRAVLAELDGWDESLPALQDTDLLLRAARIASFACLETEPIRVDASAPDRITYSFAASQVGKLQFLRKHWHLLPLRRRVRYIAQIAACMPALRAARLRLRLALLRLTS